MVLRVSFRTVYRSFEIIFLFGFDLYVSNGNIAKQRGSVEPYVTTLRRNVTINSYVCVFVFTEVIHVFRGIFV